MPSLLSTAASGYVHKQPAATCTTSGYVQWCEWAAVACSSLQWCPEGYRGLQWAAVLQRVTEGCSGLQRALVVCRGMQLALVGIRGLQSAVDGSRGVSGLQSAGVGFGGPARPVAAPLHQLDWLGGPQSAAAAHPTPLQNPAQVELNQRAAQQLVEHSHRCSTAIVAA